MLRRQRSRRPDARSSAADEPRDDVLLVDADARPDAHRDGLGDVLLTGGALAGPHLVGGCLAHAVH